MCSCRMNTELFGAVRTCCPAQHRPLTVAAAASRPAPPPDCWQTRSGYTRGRRVATCAAAASKADPLAAPAPCVGSPTARHTWPQASSVHFATGWWLTRTFGDLALGTGKQALRNAPIWINTRSNATFSLATKAVVGTVNASSPNINHGQTPQAQRVIGRAAPTGLDLAAAAGDACTLYVRRHGACRPAQRRAGQEESGGDAPYSLPTMKSLIIGTKIILPRDSGMDTRGV